MKPRPQGFLSHEKISRDSEIFDYITELHDYLWTFVFAVLPGASGSLNNYVDPAVEKTAALQTELTKLREANAELAKELNQVGQALREANAMITHFDVTLYPGWTNLSRLDISRAMELVEARSTAAKAEGKME